MSSATTSNIVGRDGDDESIASAASRRAWLLEVLCTLPLMALRKAASCCSRKRESDHSMAASTELCIQTWIELEDKSTQPPATKVEAEARRRAKETQRERMARIVQQHEGVGRGQEWWRMLSLKLSMKHSSRKSASAQAPHQPQAAWAVRPALSTITCSGI